MLGSSGSGLESAVSTCCRFFCILLTSHKPPATKPHPYLSHLLADLPVLWSVDRTHCQPPVFAFVAPSAHSISFYSLVVCQLSSSHTWTCCLKLRFPVDPVCRSTSIFTGTCLSVPNNYPRACRPVGSTSASGQRQLLLVLPNLLISGC